jgi:hypothetical protein
MGYFRLKLGLLGGARQGPEQEPGPLPVHCIIQVQYTPGCKSRNFHENG